jgi:hypothetical protein
MIVFVTVGAVVGFALGLRFRVFVLFPVTLAAVCAIAATGHGLSAIAPAMLATAVLLQVGYILGCVVQVYAGAYIQARATPNYRSFKVERGVAS